MAQIIVGTGIAPATPIAGQVTVYAKAADKKLYYKDEAGIETGPLGTGTVAAVSIVSAGGFTGSVANPTTSPAITLATSITGVLKGVAGALAIATNADLPVMSATVGGAVPTPPNDATKFLNGQGAFTVPGITAGSVTQVSLAAGVAGNGPAFSAYASVATSVTSTVKIALGAESFDTAGSFDSTTNSRFQPLIAGYYEMKGRVGFGSAAIRVQCFIYKNGTLENQGPAQTESAVGVNALIFLNGTTDYLELYAYSATTQNSATGASATLFQGFLARAA